MFNSKKALETIRLQAELIEKMERRGTVPTLVHPFRKNEGDSRQFSEFMKEFSARPEFDFMIFELRERTLTEMLGVTDGIRLLELNARLGMLEILSRYAKAGGAI